jgi:uncharacterized membrane protein YhfC
MAESSKDFTVCTFGVIFASLFETMFPIILGLISIKKYNGKTSNILKGVSGFVVSVMIESLFLYSVSLLFGKESTIFYLIAGISPGLFEETAKYLLIKYIYSKEKQKIISISYGIGHGGIESFMTGIVVSLNIFAKDTLIEKGALTGNVTFIMCIMSALERLFAISIQISLSVVNYKAIREQNINYYIFAIILHDIIDGVAFLNKKGIVTSIYILELIIGIYSLCYAWYAYNLYINFIEKEEEINIPLEDKKESSIRNEIN